MTPWTVVVTCHDYGRFLRAAVESALVAGERAGGVRVVIVDDGSTDETPLICSALVAERPDAVMAARNGTPRGASAARNIGADLAGTLYLCHLDADDKLGPDYLVEAGRALAAGADVVYPDQMAFGARSLFQPSLPAWPMARALEVNTVVISAAHRTGLWRRLGGFTEGMGYYADWDYWLRALKTGARFEYLAGGLHFFRREHDAMWTRDIEADDESFAAAVAEMREQHPDLAPLARVASYRRAA